jgi:hypothetical protein
MVRATALKSAAKSTAAAKPRTKTAKPDTFCLVTGEKTSGGLFKPGMDARYVSELVNAVMTKATTEASARKKLREDGVSEALVNKFNKALGLRREAASKAAPVKAAAPAAKPARPARKTAAKKAAAAAPAVGDEDPDGDDGF